MHNQKLLHYRGMYCDFDFTLHPFTAATSVLLRRDMSLNRRLYNWLCGSHETTKAASKGHHRNESEVSIDEDVSIYFGHYSKNLLIEAIKIILQRSLQDDNQPDLRPYRLVMTLLDKPEVGNVILEHVIIDIFRALFHSMSDLKEAKKGHQELIKSANLLFGTLESSFIWDFCGKSFEKASCQRFRINDNEVNPVNDVSSQDTTVIEMCALVDFLLDIVSIETYIETASEHLPNLFKSIVGVLTNKVQDLTAFEVTQALGLAKKILSKVQPAWNAWDIDVSNQESKINEVGKEATESLSPPSDENNAELGVDIAKSFENVPRAHETLMKECIDSYQDFYVTFLKVKAFHGFDTNECLAKLVKRPHDTLEERTRYLEQLLKGQDSENDFDQDDHISLEQLKLKDGLHKFTPALTLCSGKKNYEYDSNLHITFLPYI